MWKAPLLIEENRSPSGGADWPKPIFVEAPDLCVISSPRWAAQQTGDPDSRNAQVWYLPLLMETNRPPSGGSGGMA